MQCIQKGPFKFYAFFCGNLMFSDGFVNLSKQNQSLWYTANISIDTLYLFLAKIFYRGLTVSGVSEVLLVMEIKTLSSKEVNQVRLETQHLSIHVFI